jgi:hypothetical protein
MITEARIYWDSQDCANEGWAYRLRSHDGHEESGEYEPHASIEGNNGQLEVELVALLWRHDVDDTAGGICSDSHNELYAEWTRNEEGA